MRQPTPPSLALGNQVSDWRRPLEDDPALDAAVLRMLQMVDSLQQRDRESNNEDVSRAAAD